MKKDYSYINKSFVSIIMTFMLFSGIVYAEDTHEWKIDISQTSLYNLSFMYSTSTKVPISVEIDDVKIENIIFDATGTATKQSTKVFRLLENGEHTVRLSEIGRGALPDIKSLKVEVAQKPVQLIIDTDMMTDPDDMAAVALGHTLSDNGEAEILAIGLSAYDQDYKLNSIAVSAINYYYNRKNIPIGSWWEVINSQGNISESMRKNFRYDDGGYPKKDGYHEGFQWYVNKNHLSDHILNYKRRKTIDIYLEALNAADDHSVVIVVLGTSFNIAHLMKRDIKLFSRKVKEVVMAEGINVCGPNNCGVHDESDEAKKATDYIYNHLRGDIQLTITYSSIHNKPKYHVNYVGAESSPMKTGFENSRYGSREFHDQLAVLVAVRGIYLVKNDLKLTIEEKGYLEGKFESLGEAVWKTDKYKKHRVVLGNSSDASVLKVIMRNAMLQEPKATYHYPTNIPTKIYKADNYAWYVPIDYNMVY